MEVKYRKKLIEVALPLDAINAASAREKSIRHGHPSTLHLWWARRPLAAARAVIFAQMVDDPSAWPERFPTEEEQDEERARLFTIIEQLVLWENTTNERVLEAARAEIRRCWRDACEDNKDHPRAEELFDPDKLPGFHDPFCGGGTIPLEAQRLGLEAHGSDLNPVAVLITKAMIEIPPKFSGRVPVGPLPPGEREQMPAGGWAGTSGLAEDVRRYGLWMRSEAKRQLEHLYPTIRITDRVLSQRPDLARYRERDLTVLAWIWVRTVRSPDPSLAGAAVPLASSFILSSKPGKEVYIQPRRFRGRYSFQVQVGPPEDPERARRGTRSPNSSHFECLLSGTPIPLTYIDEEASAGRLGTQLLAVVAEGDRERVYLSPTDEMQTVAEAAAPSWTADTPCRGTWGSNAQGRRYGFHVFGDYFLPRQLLALTTFADLVQAVRQQVVHDSRACAVPDDNASLEDGGSGLAAYADAVATYLGFAVSRMANYSSSLCLWSSHPKDQLAKQVFLRQGIAMTWDFAETNPFSAAGGTLATNISYLCKAIRGLSKTDLVAGSAAQLDARNVYLGDRVVATDPPYYDNVSYADLSDYFYVWLRRALKPVFPNLFSTLATPKAAELIASPSRQGNKERAGAFFLAGMTAAVQKIGSQAHPCFPTSIFYAFRQSERAGDKVVSSGWETFLEAVGRAGLAVVGTWPMRTELVTNLKKDLSALASSTVLVCRPRRPDSPIATRREFANALTRELPTALRHLQNGNIAPVDLAQAAIGPGMAIYCRYSKVLDADGASLTVRDALALINRVLDEVLAQQEGEFDADTRFAVAWFSEFGFTAGAFGRADVLARAKNTSVSGLERAGVLVTRRGKVRLLRPSELPLTWDPRLDDRLTVWEATHHLSKRLEKGEHAAAELSRGLGGVADEARDLAYRLFVICERRQWPEEALVYNGLVQSWPEIQRLVAEGAGSPAQGTLGI